MKNKIAILVAIGVGLLAIVLIYSYLNQRDLAAGAQSKVPVVAARRNLAEGRELTAADWEVSEVSAAFYARAKHSLIRENEIGAYNGQTLTRPYSRGQYISPLTFRSVGAPAGLDIQPGCRAVTINVDDVSGVAGLIRPMNRVDIVIVQRLLRAPIWQVPGEAGGAEGSRPSTKGERIQVTVFRNVLVLATERRTAALDAENVRRGGYTTVTFELPDEKAILLRSVTNIAEITLMLRSQNDPPGDDIVVEVDSAGLLETLKRLQKGEPAPAGS